MYLKKLYMCRNYVLFVFHNLFVSFRATSVDIEEANRTVYLNMTRTNGIDLAVSVEWETISETAFGISTFYFLWEQNSITKKGRMYKIYIFPHELYLMDLLKMQNRYLILLLQPKIVIECLLCVRHDIELTELKV